MTATYLSSTPYPWPFDGDLRPDNTALIIIDMQTACGIDNNDIQKLSFRRLYGIFSNVDGVLADIAVIKIKADIFRQGLQLLDSRRTIDIDTHDTDFLFLILFN